MMSAGTDVCNQSTVCSCVSRDVSFSSMKGDLEDDFLEDFVEKEGEASLHSTILSNTAKYIQKSSQYKPDVRQYFDPFHATHPSNSSAQLTSPIRESSQTLDEYSSVAGHYFKDIIIPRVSSRKSNSRKSRSQSISDKEYVFQQTACLPELRIKTTALRHQKLPPKRIHSANTRQLQTMRSIKSSPSILPSSCPFQNVSVPESMELIIYPYRSLVESQEVNSIVGKDSVGHVIEIHQNFTFSELKICIFNGALCNVPSSSSSSSRPLSKEEYSKRLKSFRIWILDPVSSSTNWIQLRSQTDWERVKVLKWLESSSQERLKLLYDEGVIHSRKIDKSCGNGDIDDSVTTNTNPRRDSDSVDHGETDRLEQERRPRLHLLTERKPVNEHNSPIKQQQMAKILEQRIILSRI